MKQKGFTLIETILYIGIVLILLGAFLPMILQIADTTGKSNNTGKVYDAGRYASERLIYEIRNAKNIVSTSSFGTNFAASSGAKLVLRNFSSTLDPTIFAVNASTGVLTVTQGTGSAVYLMPSGTKVSSLIFTNLSTSSLSNVNFNMILNDSFSNPRTEFNATATISGSAELRSK